MFHSRNTRNRWFVASVPRIFRPFTNLFTGLLANLSRPRCISNCWRGEGKFRFCKLFETHTRGAPVTRILSGRLSWNFHDFPPPSFSTRICISWFFYVHHFLFTTRYIFHQNIYIYFFSLLYYRTFILNLSIPFPLFLKKLKNSNLQWFINKQSSSNDSKRITV